MGCDIHTFCERRLSDGTYERVPYTPWERGRNYGMFAFLAGVRNYGAIKPLSEPRGLPTDLAQETQWDTDSIEHSASWFTIQELLDVNYDQIIEDRRCTTIKSLPGGGTYSDGGSTAPEGAGEKMTLRSYLGELYFQDLDNMRLLGVFRVIFGFDN